MLTQQKKREQGFTIIEVMIVLAIAGLIMLIVFLAVPALQRSSRNTQRTQDAGQVGTAANDVISNNNGDITRLTTPNLQAQLPSLAYYLKTNVSVAAGVTGPSTAPDVDHVIVYTGAVCTASGTGQGATTRGASARQLAVVYMTEPSVPDCKSL